MLLNLHAIRESNFSAERDEIVAQYGPRKLILLGDQDILNIYANMHPEDLFEMPCTFNFRMHEACRDGMPAILHGNRNMHAESYTTYSHLYKVFRSFHIITGTHSEGAAGI